MVRDGLVRAAGPVRDVASTVPYRFLLPGVPADMVRRERLVSVVGAGLHRQVTTVTAPAGSGKTTLLAAWARQVDAPVRVCWLTLEAEDGDPAVLLTHVVAGVRRCLGPVPRRSGTDPGDWSAVDMLVGAQDDGGVLVLVLDDADVLSAAAGRELLDAVRRSAGRLHLVVLSRATPRLPLYRLRLADQLTEVRADALAFTAPETDRLLRTVGVDLPGEQLHELQRRTRGWPVGTRFAAMTLAGCSDTARAVEQFTGDVGDVAEYLLEEVLRWHSPQVRTALMRCSVADHLDPGLVEALTGTSDGRDLLTSLAQGNLFVQAVPDRPGHHVLQPLFRAFLRARLDLEHPGEADRLHLVAAHRLAADGQFLGSVRHAGQVGAWEVAARHLLDGGGLVPLLVGPDARPLASAYANVPEAACGVAADLVGAASALAAGDPAGCARRLQRVRGRLVREDPADAADMAAASVLQALVDQRGGDASATVASVADALGACAVVPAVDPDVVALMHATRGRALLSSGQLVRARADLDAAVAVAGRSPTSAVLPTVTATAALVQAVSGRLRRAEELVRRADGADGADGAGRVGGDLPRDAAVASAWVASERSDHVAAEEALVRVPHAGRDDLDPVTAALLGLVRVRLLRARGDSDLAHEQLRALRESAGPLGWLVTPPSAGPVPTQGSGAYRLADRVTLLLTDVARLLGAGRPREAGDVLEQALLLAAPEHLRQPFLDLTPGLGGLVDPSVLRRHRWLRSSPVPGPRVGGSTSQAPTRRIDVAVPVERLTAKEREVLQHLAELLTTEEIAAVMFVSVNTVRTHVRGVLRKLSAQRRNEAVRRAWALGLLTHETSPAGTSRTGSGR